MSQYQTSVESKIRCRIAYKLKSDSPTFKGCFDLIPGCIVTDVQSSGLSVGNNKLSKKMYTFWIVWPIDKNSKQEKRHLEEPDHQNNAQQFNFEEIGRSGDGDYESGGEDDKNNARRDKDLKKILAQQELESQRVIQNRSRAEEQIASHQAHDNNISLGVKIAAVAAGGAVSVLLYNVPLFHCIDLFCCSLRKGCGRFDLWNRIDSICYCAGSNSCCRRNGSVNYAMEKTVG